MWLKSCPRCKRGDLVLNGDIYGPRVLCLQCGYTKDLKAGLAKGAILQQARKTGALARESLSETFEPASSALSR